MMSVSDFGNYIHTKRKEKGLTQEAFASLLGITPQAVSKWENGVGYPDIVLFTEISKVLDVSLDELFGNVDTTSENKKSAFPKTVNKLPRIAVFGNRALYSDKSVSAVDKNKVSFSDGSEADFSDGSVVNIGKGEVSFYELEPEEKHSDDLRPLSLSKDLDQFSSVSVTINGSFGLEIIKSNNGIFRIQADGSASFIDSLEMKLENGRFTLSNKVQRNNFHRNNSVKLYVGFPVGDELELTINGSGGGMVSPDFKKVTVTVNGSGAIKTKNCGSLFATVNGSGALDFADCGDVAFTVNGSGAIRSKACANSKIKISGSGDINVDKVSGDSDISIHGSGDVSLSGVVGLFSCNVDGSGNILCEGLTVREASLIAKGAAEIKIGRICERSFEKLSKSSKLTVGQRG